MHGRLKVKTTAEQDEAKRKEREKKLKFYKAGTAKAFDKRRNATYDQEALDVTGELLAANSDFYTLWNIRREVFVNWKENKSEEELRTVFQNELYFLEQCLRGNPKSYGSWQHRMWVMDNMPKPDWQREMGLCNKFLDYDERNFHCWDYRRYAVQKSEVSPEEELEFTTNKISTNFSNFSSWHYRSKLLPKIHSDPDHPVGVKEQELLKEFELVQNAFFTDPSDQSAWFYHRWLLGRGHRPLDVECLQVRRDLQQIVVTLTKPAKLTKDFSLVVTVDEQDMTVSWTAASKHGYSSVWLGACPALGARGGEQVQVALSLNGRPSQICVLPSGDNCSVWRRAYRPGTRFSYELSAATVSTLTQELESCLQLHQLEPDNKWTLLTIVSLMRALDPLRYEPETLEYIAKLIQTDPLRENYYKDLRCKFLMENTIEESKGDSISLSDKGLTALPHADHLATMATIDLCTNLLTSVQAGCVFVTVVTLRLDNNRLTTCDGLSKLPALEQLSLKNNNIAVTDSLRDLASCARLHCVWLEGNPLCGTPDYRHSVQLLLPGLKTLS